MRQSNLTQLGDLLGGAVDRAGIRRNVNAAVIVEAGNHTLENLFGDGILIHARCISFTDGVLRLYCTHAALAEEIQRRSKEMILQVTERVPRADIREVSLRVRVSTSTHAAWYDAPQES